MSAPSLQLLLPERLERLVPAARRGLPFGVPALDAMLPGGVPRGQITALDAPLGSGGTALLLALAETTLRADEGAAIVDAERSLAPQAAAHLAALGPFWVVRPKARQSAWWCADVLLRTGAFGLVIVDQAPAPARQVAIRLQRTARDKDTALVIRMRTRTAAGEEGPGDRRGEHSRGAARRAPGPTSARLPSGAPFAALVLAVRPLAGGPGFIPGLAGRGGAWPAPRTLHVMIEKGGAPRAAEVPVGFSLPHRLRPHWAVRDRRAYGRNGAAARQR
ncbi:MAG: hypothetical protein HY705_01705 [Gemmatimonadetes bacterium]|nr:hypothetical protein [Gemmatimonadota bacterium]